MKKLRANLVIILLFVSLFVLSSCVITPPEPAGETTINSLSFDFDNGSINIQFGSSKKITEVYYVYKTDTRFDFAINANDSVDSAVINILNGAKENGFFAQENCKILMSSSATDIAINVLAQANVRCIEFFDANALENTHVVYFVFALTDTQITTAKEYSISPALFALAQSQVSFSDDLQYVAFIGENTLSDLMTNASEEIEFKYDYFSYDYSSSDVITYKDAKYTALLELKEDGIETYFFELKYRLDIFNGKLAWIIDLYDESDDYRFVIDAYRDEILKAEYHVHSDGRKFGVSKTSEESLQKALEHALVSQDKLVYYTVRLEGEYEKNSRFVYYVVKFGTRYSKFEYKINADTLAVEEYYLLQSKSIDAISKYNIISYQNAVESALVSASVTDFNLLTVELVCDGSWFYRVEFYKGQTYYSVEVDAFSGAILYSQIDGTTSEEEVEYISIKEAKQSVYDDASRGEVITDSEVEKLSIFFKEVEIDGVDTKVYVVEFLYKEKQYSYTVDASDGIVLERLETPQTSVEMTTNLSQASAIQKVLAVVGANINEVSIECELKSPYGRDNALYHLRFTYRGNVYYFVVDADTGFIVEFLNEPIV